MRVEVTEELLDLGFVARERAVGPGLDGEVVPMRVARGLRVRRDHLDASLDQIAQAVYDLGVDLAH